MLSTNPFQLLLAGISETEAKPVTLTFLDWVSATVNKPSIVIQNYGEAFQVLEFLANARVVELIKLSNPEQYTIRKINYGN